jgi:DNA-binding transcriptional ArsR family regulator
MRSRTIVGHISKVMHNRYGPGRSNNRDFQAATVYICGMTSLNLNIAEVASLVGDPARTNILAALMDGRALTSTELAYIARVAPQTASGHLAKLTRANLLAVESQGRRRYYRITSALVGQMLESIMAVAADQAPLRRARSSRIDEQMRSARTCYDHLAGRLGVALAEILVERGHVVLTQDGGEATETGLEFLLKFGVNIAERKQSKRVFCRPCLEWSERRVHIAGSVGAKLCQRCLKLGWIKRLESTRALEITAHGRRGFAEWFGMDFSNAEAIGTRP